MLSDNELGVRRRPTDYPYIRFLPCKAEPGLFHDEFLVYIEGIDPSSVSNILPAQLFVDRDQVKNLDGIPTPGNPASGWLRVALAGEEDGLAWVVLPQHAVPVGESILVKEEVLRKGPDA